MIVQQEGDVVGLFHQLWKKNSQGLPCPEVNVPHTVSERIIVFNSIFSVDYRTPPLY